ncbi:MAG: adaptor protein MecA [Clostridia bacterium]|nr:adaptor protein MecA [Clostridia bacterium]
MRIEKITENKIRIILNIEDLEEKNIDLHSFMSTSIESQDLFYDMLDKAEKEIGFNTKDYKLMIEALSVPER